MTRVCVLMLLLASVALAGCGSSKPTVAPPAVAAAAPVEHTPARVLRKRTFLRRVNRICARTDGSGIGQVPAVTTSVAHNRVIFGAYFGRVHRVIRRVRRRLVRVGVPKRDRARWTRAMSKLLAAERHLDTMRAAAWSGSVPMLRLSARELQRTAKSAERRFRLFGATRCA